MNAETAFREQQIAKHQPRALKLVRDVENLWDKFEAVSDVQRSRNHSGIIAKSSAEHLPKVALLGLGRDSCGRARSLAVNDHYWGFDHGGHAQTFAHHGEAAARRGAHGADTRMRPADGHAGSTECVL